MSNQREALQMALDALDCIYSPLHVREINKVGAAMAAIREALTEPIDPLQDAAPDLLKALEEIAEWTDRYTSPGHPISTVARAAIAKAKREV